MNEIFLINTEKIDELSDFFKIMGDSTRIKIMLVLENGELCVNDMSKKLNMTKSAISHQLKILKNAKLTKAQKRGKNVFYSLCDYHIKTVLDMALEHIQE